MVIEGINAGRGMQVSGSVQTSGKTVENKDVTAAKNGEYTTSTQTDNYKPAETEANEAGAPVSGKEEENNATSGKVTNEQLKKAIEKFNKSMGNSEAVFGVHEETNRVMIKIIDKDTKETIKELPPEKTLDMIAKVWEMAGILVDEKR